MFLKIVIIRGTFLLFHLLLRYAISFLFVPLERVTRYSTRRIIFRIWLGFITIQFELSYSLTERYSNLALAHASSRPIR